MKTKVKIIGLLSFLVALMITTSCKKNDKDNNTDSKVQTIDLTKSQIALINSSNNFGFNLYKEISSKTAADSNIFISPLSVSLALAMTYNGANGTTKEAMTKTLDVSSLSDDEINTSFKNLMNSLQSADPKVTVNIANSIWYRNTFSVIQSFIDVNKNYYFAQVTALDFNDPASVTTINNWVDNQTNHKIPTIIDVLTSDLVMCLINAVYFKGIWEFKFDENKTENDDFYPAGPASVSVPFMVTEENINYMSNDLLSAVELKYGRGNYSMLVLLPNSGKTIEDVSSQLSDASMNSWTGQMKNDRKVQVHLPKFKLNLEYSLNQTLSALGMSIAFSPDSADFSRINATEQLYISTVKHKTFVEVNEEGTEAAAVTFVGISNTSVGPQPVQPILFYANHPFIFAIREITTNTILFIGKISSL